MLSEITTYYSVGIKALSVPHNCVLSVLMEEWMLIGLMSVVWGENFEERRVHNAYTKFVNCVYKICLRAHTSTHRKLVDRLFSGTVWNVEQKQ